MDAPSQSVGEHRASPNRVLVLGSTGMVGRSWMELLKNQQIPCVGRSRPEFDLMEPSTITNSISDEFDLVVNAAAWTDVDGAETDEQGATRANAEALAEIAQCCKSIGSTLISYSTDYVFSGDADTPYAINSPIDPINAYGRSKAIGEAKLAESDASHIMIRTSWVYAPWGTNFVRTIRGLAASRDELRVVDDQRGRPTSAQHLAESSLALYLNGAQGIWHLTDEGECTWHQFAREIVRIAGLHCTVHPCTSDEYPRPAARPGYSTLDISDSTQLVGPLGSWQSHLAQVLEVIASETIN
ncbi:MAG: dTDP-4-dehydrorhamnose reductase [Phycisphaerales bacterium]|nr:dTDP-4-dehydrorhamnose reductase [Phycisphaerales bacterium]